MLISLLCMLSVEGIHGILCPVMITGGELQPACLALTVAPGDVKPLWVTWQVFPWVPGGGGGEGLGEVQVGSLKQQPCP